MDKATSLLDAEDPTGEEPREPAFSRAPVRAIESGVFPGARTRAEGDDLVGNLQGALTAASRGEAGLTSLQRSLRDASRALTASRHAHQALTEELREMYRALTEMSAEKAAIERYAALLTQERDAALDAADEARRDAKREREFLVREQDRFIQLIVEEHEAELERLRAELARARRQNAVDPAPAAVRHGDTAEPLGETAERLGHTGVTPYTAERLARVEQMRSEGGFGEAAAEQYRLPSEEVDREIETRRSSYPPGVLELDASEYEIARNSERPPPLRRLEVELSEAHEELRPARVPEIPADEGDEAELEQKH